MAISIQARIPTSELRKFERSIQRLTDERGKAVGKATLNRVLKSSAEPLAETIRSRTGEAGVTSKPGRLRKSVKIQKGRGRAPSALVGYRSSAIRYQEMLGAEYGNRITPRSSTYGALRKAAETGLRQASAKFVRIWRPIIESAARQGR